MADPFEYERRILSSDEVIELIAIALVNREPLSLARFGHGELYFAKWPHTTEPWIHMPYYTRYAGADVEPRQIQKAMIAALHAADITGLFSRWEDESSAIMTAGLLEELQFRPYFVCSPLIMYELLNNPGFWHMLKDKRVLLIGRRARESEQIILRKGVKSVQSLNLNGLSQISRVQKQALESSDSWDIALVAAGIPATILVPQIAKKHSKVAIDFGHALDILIEGKSFDHEQIVSNFNTTHLLEE